MGSASRGIVFQLSTPNRLKGQSPIKLTLGLKEASHRQKFNGTIHFPESRHQYIYSIPIFEKPIDELDPIAYVDKDRAHRRLQARRPYRRARLSGHPIKLDLLDQARRQVSRSICICIDVESESTFEFLSIGGFF